ncbi:MAG TPA: class I SAM-dependent methyltransferase [Thermomicrobiales bacterium]|nr:class I SAM-dependent methyltransferase [Thermomicrobiales bacterium]
MRGTSEERKRLVEAGYDRIAERYLASRDALTPETVALLERLLRGTPVEAPVLDLGCGAGVPVARRLAQRRPVIGVDRSARQLALARRLVPGATLLRADMAAVAFRPATFGGVVALSSIIHVPRPEQPPLLARIHRWLRPGGGFLATWAVAAWEGEDRDWLGWGTPMWRSHFDGATNLALLREAGFSIEAAELRSDSERWLWVLARKPER